MKTFLNPIIPGFHPDPSICRVGSDYYLATSSFEYFPGVPIFHSRDLIHWKKIGHALTRDSQLDLRDAGDSGGIYAPTLRYHNGIFYMVTTHVYAKGNFYVTAKDPAGPWSEPIYLNQGGIDPSFLFDEDGKVYLTTSQNMQSEIDLATGELLTEPRQIWAGSGGNDLEAPHLYKINGWYYLLCAEGGTHHGHMITIARSRSPWGPFESCPNNPILTNRHRAGHDVQATGHGDLFQAHDGSWWIVCLAIRTGKTHFPKTHHLGRETFLAPVTWDADGWPIINHSGTLDIETEAPRLPHQPFPEESPTDNFDAPTLSPEWVHLRNPKPEHYSLNERPGWLRLKADANSSRKQQPTTCLLRRQTDFECTASTLLDFKPTEEGQEAGMLVWMNSRFHYRCFLSIRSGRLHASLLKQIGDITHLANSVEVDTLSGPYTLKVEANSESYAFSIETSNCQKIDLGTGLVRLLTTEVAGGFTGMMLGIYANSCASPTTADFDYFIYNS
ncbi:glycoside hydrolase family 43 protein [Coraliomargarita parva]|uniref:glycoside hydrolase family 43 protein n=1 Tax=Coraliomargarita parva TaxID=3014050 RepID=UPI0022B37297|nr:glycoside hydrolase family 43 protein [Coraliomargarita parva]